MVESVKDNRVRTIFLSNNMGRIYRSLYIGTRVECCTLLIFYRFNRWYGYVPAAMPAWVAIEWSKLLQHTTALRFRTFVVLHICHIHMN